ncbi:MAG: sugar phosphate nucleotidyltransferase [Candidatus Thermoplasmatota archaeon]|nr:sugar phosphate nucleotidyltransferase [Candidatus Thermoplasmatota archaeon]
MKGLITAAGLGTRSGLDGRLRKELLPIYLKIDGRVVLRPLIDAIYSRIRSLGIEEIGIVIGKSDIMTRAFIEENIPDASIIYQDSPDGFGDAVRKASEFIEDEPFILNAGDGMIMDIRHIKAGMDLFNQSGSQVLYLMHVDNPQRYGIAEVIDAIGYTKNIKKVRSLEEKPVSPKSNLALCACYILSPWVISNLLESAVKPLELTPSINTSIAAGRNAMGIEIGREEWISVGYSHDYLQVLKRTYESAVSDP